MQPISGALYVQKLVCRVTITHKAIIWNVEFSQWKFHLFLPWSLNVYFWSPLLQCHFHHWYLCCYCCGQSYAHLPIINDAQFWKIAKNSIKSKHSVTIFLPFLRQKSVPLELSKLQFSIYSIFVNQRHVKSEW